MEISLENMYVDIGAWRVKRVKLEKIGPIFKLQSFYIMAIDKRSWLKCRNRIILNKTEPLFWGISLIPGYLKG